MHFFNASLSNPSFFFDISRFSYGIRKKEKGDKSPTFLLITSTPTTQQMTEKS